MFVDKARKIYKIESPQDKLLPDNITKAYRKSYNNVYESINF